MCIRDSQNDSLNKRKSTGKYRVADNGESCDCEDEKSAVPSFGGIGTVVENNDALYLASCKKSDGRETSLPSKNTQPPWDLSV